MSSTPVRPLVRPLQDCRCRAAKRRVRVLERAYRRADKNYSAVVSTAEAAWKSERRSYCLLVRQKREEFWKFKVDSERSTPRRLWQSVNSLLERGHVPSTDSVDANTLHRFFDTKWPVFVPGPMTPRRRLSFQSGRAAISRVQPSYR